MSAPILKTKLYPPSIRPEIVSRSRLIERLSVGLGRKLTLVSAPAGFGKTTLVGDWLSREERPFAWLSLDEGDNDLVRFLTYIVAALQQIDPNLGQTIYATLQAPQPPAIEPLISVLINDIAALNTPFVFVLDDYHTIKLPAIHKAVTFLLDRMPPHTCPGGKCQGMHLVIATREDPPIPISRLRVLRQMTEVRAIDLRFTEEESIAFLNQAMHLNLTPEDVVALEARTEGWIAGLQLAALSMQGEPTERTSAFIKAFTGSHRYVVDYLAEEVLERQPPSTKAFLLHTSILNRLTGSLCDAVRFGCAETPSSSFGTAVTDQSDGQVMLEQLEEANLFLVPLDHERRWYRYHHLFADLLRNQLEATQPDMVPTLHRRASTWYADNDLMSEAIAHSLAAKDFERAAQLTEQTFIDRMSRGEDLSTMLARLVALPDEIIRARPRFGIMYAWMLSIILQPDTVEPRLQEIEKSVGDQLPADLRRQMDHVRAELARHRGDFVRAIELSHQVLEKLPNDFSIADMQTFTGSVFNLGWAYLQAGDVIKAQHWFSEALPISEAAITLTLMAMRGLAHAQMVQGQLHQAAETYRQGLQLADKAAQDTGQVVSAATYVHLGMGNLLREWNELDEADRHLTQGIELGKKSQVDGSTLREGFLFQVQLKQAQGQRAGALDALQQVERLAQAYQTISGFADSIAAHRAWLTLVSRNRQPQSVPTDGTSDLQAVEQWIEARELRMDGPINSLDSEFEYLVWARLLIAQGKPNRALELLTHLFQAAKEYGRTGRVIEMLILQALAHQALGDTEQALTVLEQALTLAEPEGYVRLFADEGVPMAKMLRQAASRGIAPDYVSKLQSIIKAQDDVFSPQPLAPSTPSLLDPLSERELDVLRLLDTDLSGSEIAAELVVSVNTIKTHIKRIYSKLGAHSRYEAVVRAKELDLL